MTEIEIQDAIAKQCDELKFTLIRKNQEYGNSAISPCPFCQIQPSDAILVRLGDQVKRLSSQVQNDYVSDDTILDIAGYCVLYQIAKDIERDGGTC